MFRLSSATSAPSSRIACQRYTHTHTRPFSHTSLFPAHHTIRALPSSFPKPAKPAHFKSLGIQP
jgi:hypothetical protein